MIHTPLTITTLGATVIAAVIATLAMTGCTPAWAADPLPTATIETSAPPAAAVPSSPTPTASRTTSAPQTAYPVAAISGGVDVHSQPDPLAPAVTVEATTPYGTDRVLRIVEATADGSWFRVVIPARPNNATGWIPAADIDVRAVSHHISVDLSERSLVLTQGGIEILRTTVAVGTAANPTPTGEFFVTDMLETDPDGAYGPYAFGVAAWSETLSQFGDGDGQIAIHGTDDPGALGTAASHGCIRVSNDVAEQLAAILALGVPVDIAA